MFPVNGDFFKPSVLSQGSTISFQKSLIFSKVIEWIWLHNNEISSLNYTILNEMYDLKYVDLTNNQCFNGWYYYPCYIKHSSNTLEQMKGAIRKKCSKNIIEDKNIEKNIKK